MSSDRFDWLNTLGTLSATHTEGWVPVDGLADHSRESMSAIEARFDVYCQQSVVERRGVDRDPDYRLTRSGETYVAENS